MRILVTGGAGFIGSHVARALSNSGHHVTILDTATAADRVDGLASVDVRDERAVRNLLESKSIEWVFHMAAISSGRTVARQPVESIHVNVVGTCAVLEAARKAQVNRVVIASSIFVYGAMPAGHLSEGSGFSATGGGHVHTTAFIAKELLARDFGARHGLATTILRLGPVYGERMWKGLAMEAFIEQARGGGPIIIRGDSNDHRPFIHSDDVAEACVSAISPTTANETYNIIGPADVTIRALADLVASHYQVPVVVHHDDSRAGELSLVGRTLARDKATAHFGWSPKVTIEEGVRRVIEGLR
jgi:UDP-glucose 4-epimerase